MLRDAQGCSGMLRDAQGCSGLLRAAQGCSGLLIHRSGYRHVYSGLEVEMDFGEAKIGVRVFGRLPQEGSRNGLTFKADILRLGVDCFCVARIKGSNNRVVMT
jgi:hypothetical protein